MKPNTLRQTVDLADYPDLVVIYLGMRANRWRGIRRLLKTGRRISAAVAQKPAGLLLHENLIFSLLPPHFGMRQYWRDFESLEAWSRSLPHLGWWKELWNDAGGTSFWHETYFMGGGIEAVYDDHPGPLGLKAFAPVIAAEGSMLTARRRLRLSGEAPAAEGIDGR